VAGPIARRPKAPSLSCQLARQVSCTLKLSWSLRLAKDALAAHPPKLQLWPCWRSRSSSPVLLLLIPNSTPGSGLLIWKGNQVRAALPLSNPGPCRTGQAKVLVRALQCDRMVCRIRGYGSSRWAGRHGVLAYHDGGWVIFCSDSGGGMGRRRFTAALGRVWEEWRGTRVQGRWCNGNHRENDMAWQQQMCSPGEQRRLGPTSQRSRTPVEGRTRRV
jgi:hypothetical protein